MGNNDVSVPKTNWFEFSISVMDVRASGFNGYCFWNESIFLTFNESNQYSVFGADGPHLFGFTESIYVTVFRISNNIYTKEIFTKKNKKLKQWLDVWKLFISTELFLSVWSVVKMKPCALKAHVDSRGFSVMKVGSHNNTKQCQRKIQDLWSRKKYAR